MKKMYIFVPRLVSGAETFFLLLFSSDDIFKFLSEINIFLFELMSQGSFCNLFKANPV